MSEHNFNWNRPRTVQTISTNNIIQSQQMTPKQVIVNGGNRIQSEHVIASLIEVVKELIEIQEDSANRVNKLLTEAMGKKNVANEPRNDRTE